MATCLITSGYSLGCRNQAGVQKVFIGSWNGSLLTYTYEVDGFTIATFSGATTSFYGFAQTVETASYTYAAEYNNENNAVQYVQTLEITLPQLTAELINQTKLLNQGVWRIIILDKAGNYWLQGKTGPVQTSASDGGLGKSGTDLHGVKLTFTSKEDQLLSAVSASAAAKVIVQ